MDLKDIHSYCHLMDEVKGRIVMLEKLASGKMKLQPDLARLEFSALLLRKSLEQVALANLVSNKVLFTLKYKHFAECYHAKYILNDIAAINPDFYPVPMEHGGKDPATGISQMNIVQNGYLTRKDFEKAYEKCAALLHADNPYGSKPDLSYHAKKIPEWNRMLHRLLFQHRIQIVNDPSWYLIHLNEDDGKSRHYTLTPIEMAVGPQPQTE
jgi:hypothetical protein